VRVGGARPPPLITFTLTSKVAVYAPAEWADTLTLFHLYQYMNSVVLAHTLCCTLYAVQLLVTSKGYRIQYTFKHKNITFTNLLLQLWKDWKVGAQWKYIIKCIYLNLMLRHGTLKSWLKCPHFIFCSKWPWPTNLVFYIIPSFLSNCTKWPYLKQSIHQGRKKQGHCV